MKRLGFKRLLFILSCFVFLLPLSVLGIGKGELAKVIEGRKEVLQEEIEWSRQNLIPYIGYRGSKVDSWAEEDISKAAFLGVMSDEVMDYFHEPITRADFAGLISSSLCVLTGMSLDELKVGCGGKNLQIIIV